MAGPVVSKSATAKLSAFDGNVVEVVRAAYRLNAMADSLRKGRLDERVGLDVPMPVSTVKPGHGYFKAEAVTWCLDISPRGMGLLSHTALTQGTVYWGNLRNLGQESYVFQLKVVHCRELVAGIFRIGAVIIGTLASPSLADAGLGV
jgi:hypothetical protein